MNAKNYTERKVMAKSYIIVNIFKYLEDCMTQLYDFYYFNKFIEVIIKINVQVRTNKRNCLLLIACFKLIKANLNSWFQPSDVYRSEVFDIPKPRIQLPKKNAE